MKISQEHLREAGLVVIDITAADEGTAHQAAVALGGCGSPAAPQPRGARPAGPASPSACTPFFVALPWPAAPSIPAQPDPPLPPCH
ncbi:DUF6207 family protein [Streptomyces decoyicus]|uniref:DUF6207 family protein n=1 Tax=Streptomyces decoyicus TaxID=249567 RepID=UPI00365954F3